jgi:hypothetical protein
VSEKQVPRKTGETAMRGTCALAVAAMLAWVTGCGGGFDQAVNVPPQTKQAPPASGTTQTPAPAQPAGQPQQGGISLGVQGTASAAGMAPLDMGAAPVGGQSKPAPQPTYEQAKVGAGAQGRDYGGGTVGKLITTPIQTYWAGRSKIAFDIQVPMIVRDYKMFHDDKAPTHEEFMKMVPQYNLELPQLPPGERYIFDPQSAQLLVEHPQR